MVFERSGGVADKEATITVVMGHQTKLGSLELFRRRQTLHSRQIWERRAVVNHQVLQTSLLR
jgi:hypothetical protein